MSPWIDAPEEAEAHIAFEPTYSFEEGAVFAMLKDGGVCVNVSQEQAVDSYNQSFTCSFNMTPEQARSLRDWLIVNLRDAS